MRASATSRRSASSPSLPRPAGAATVGLNPLHALFASRPRAREPVSSVRPAVPRSAAIDLDARSRSRERAGRAQAPRRGTRQRSPRCRAQPLVDYPGVGRAQGGGARTRASRPSSAHAAADPLVRRVRRASSRPAGRRCATSRCSRRCPSSHAGRPWQRWPAEHCAARWARRRAAFAATRRRACAFTCYLQWLADRAARRGGAARARRGPRAGLLPRSRRRRGARRRGSWSQRGAFARGVSIGAPPDPFSRDGQNWGLPPPIPHALAARPAAPAYRGALRRQHAPRRRRCASTT